MFWTDQSSRIMRAGMDGSDVKIIAAGDRIYYSLAIDYFGKDSIFRLNKNI